MNDSRLHAKYVVTRRDTVIASIIVIGTFCYYFANVSSLPDVLQFTKYSVAALKLIDGNLSPERILDFSPLYLFISATAGKLSSAPVNALILLQCTLVALTSGILFHLLRRHFSLTHSLAGCAAFVFSRSVMVYCHILEPETVLVFLLVLFMFVVELRGARNAFWAGVTLSLCLLTRPSFFVLALCVPVYYYLRGERTSFKRNASLFTLPILAGFIAIVVMGNGAFPPPLMNPGTVFYDANNPLSKGVIAVYPPISAGLLLNHPDESDYQHAIYRLIARRSTGQNLSAVEVNRFWSTLAINYIVDNPWKFIQFELNKLYYLGNSYRWHDIAEAHKVDDVFQGRYLPSIPFALVSSLALLGFCMIRGKYLEFFIPGVVAASQTLLMLVTYVSDRQRLSLLPCLIIFAVAGLSFRDWPQKKKVVAVSFLLAGTVLFSWKTRLIREHDSSIENDRISQKFLASAWSLNNEGKTADAARAHAKSRALAHEYDFARLAYIPTGVDGLAGDALREFDSLRGNDYVSRLDRAVLLIEAGQLETAERLLKGMGSEAADRSEVLFQRGRIAYRRNMLREAERLFKEALTAAPGEPNVLAQLSVLTGEARYVERLRRYFDEADVLYFIGLANMEQKKYDSAVDCFKKLHDFFPDYWHGQVMLSAALSGAGKYREAADRYTSAMSQYAGVLIFPEKIADAFKRLAQDTKPDTYEQYTYGKVLHQTGDLIGARNVLQRSFKAGGRKVVAEELKRVEESLHGAGSFEMYQQK